MISVKTGRFARLTTWESAVQRTICQRGCGPLPGQLPLADVLDTMHRRAAANQVVTDRRAEPRRRHVRAIGSERGDQELRDGDVPQVASETLDFSGKGASVERRVGAAERPRAEPATADSLLAGSSAGSSGAPRNSWPSRLVSTAATRARPPRSPSDSSPRRASSSVACPSRGNASFPGCTCSRNGRIVSGMASAGGL